MKPYQLRETRVRAELDELEDRIGLLSSFIGSGLFKDVESAERELLHKQHYAMVEYAAILRQRVRRFEA